MTKVMVVDDEIYFATNIAQLLRANDEGMEVLAVYSAGEALQELDNAFYDIIVTDVRMPNMSGIEFIEAIKKKRPGTSIIVMTAYGAQDVMENAFKTGTLLYIEKPFRIEKLEALIAVVNQVHRKKSTKKKTAHARM
ncbi:MAG: response regulator [Deltaproteobacteria bacterium]|nr:response regulator [Deltaproteobacteria bacterium]